MRRKNYSIKKTHRALFQIGSTIKNLARDDVLVLVQMNIKRYLNVMKP
jgi:hypothetical protein